MRDFIYKELFKSLSIRKDISLCIHVLPDGQINCRQIVILNYLDFLKTGKEDVDFIGYIHRTHTIFLYRIVFSVSLPGKPSSKPVH